MCAVTGGNAERKWVHRAVYKGSVRNNKQEHDKLLGSRGHCLRLSLKKGSFVEKSIDPLYIKTTKHSLRRPTYRHDRYQTYLKHERKEWSPGYLLHDAVHFNPNSIFNSS